MDDCSESGQLHQLGVVEVKETRERVVNLKPDPNRILCGEVAEFVGNQLLAAAGIDGLQLFEKGEALKRILFDDETGHYTGLDISEVKTIDVEHLYRSIVITSSQGITIQGILLDNTAGPDITIHRITRIDEEIEVHPGYIRLTYTGEDTYEVTIGKILSACISLRGEAVDIQSVLFQEMTEEQMIREYYVLIGAQLKSLVISERDGTVSVNGELKNLETTLEVARYYIEELYLTRLFHELPSRLRFIRRTHPKVS